MDNVENSMYYALVWNTALSPQIDKKKSKKIVIEGEKITRSTKLPRDPRMLYGTNNNDIARIVKTDNWMEIKYDIMTQKQTVKTWVENEEYLLSRDIRIIVWEGESKLELPSKLYKVVAPDLFEHIVKTCCDGELEDIEWSLDVEHEVINLLDMNQKENLYIEYDKVVVTPDSIIYRKRI